MRGFLIFGVYKFIFATGFFHLIFIYFLSGFVDVYKLLAKIVAFFFLKGTALAEGTALAILPPLTANINTLVELRA